ncbi:MAG: LuxR C-terminal-related transcriptional regulator [Clostridia bacterium]|nr:LuxR C-terminal-related transcriptional regulator [Clostridia bacterium]
MTDQLNSTEPSVTPAADSQQTAASQKRSRSWWWIFLLLSLWVFGVRTGCLAFIHSDSFVAMARLAGSDIGKLLSRPELSAIFEQPELLGQPEYAAAFEEYLQLSGQPEQTAILDQVGAFAEPEYAAMMESTAKTASTFLYLVQILGVAVIPALLARGGVLRDGRKEKWITVGLLVMGIAILPVFLLVRGLLLRPAVLYALLYLLVLCPSTAMGIALRRGALYWPEGKAALYIGMAFVLDHVFGQLYYYSWIATENATIYLSYSYMFFAGLLIAAAVLRLRLRAEDAPALSPVFHVYPRRFPQNVCALIVIHSLFSSAINTVIYFDNMDDFHTPGYELFFYSLAFFVILAAVLLYHHRRWLAPVLIGLLLICFGQGLSLFGIQSTRLAVAYNLVTMVGKMPPLLAVMIIPVYYAVGTRRPGMACLGFAIPAGADFLMNLTQFTEKGIEGALPGQSRQGVLLLAGLCVIGAIFYLYTKFERTRTDALLNEIREGIRERKSTRETVDSLDLTIREKEVTSLLLAGDSQKMIAAKLRVSFSTVSFHTRNLYRKLNIQSKGELFALFLVEEPTVVA